jgi:hypothetical protein
MIEQVTLIVFWTAIAALTYAVFYVARSKQLEEKQDKNIRQALYQNNNLCQVKQ